MAGPIRISILANASQAKREFGSVGASADGLQAKMNGFAKKWGAGMLVVGAAATKFAADAVTAASKAQQSLGATETVFGKFSDSVIKSSEAASKRFGLSANEYRESANLIGSLFKNQGVALDQLAGKTENMIGIGTDLAATFGGTTADAVAALGSAFKGEFDPLERYGISLKQSTVNAEASALAQAQYGRSLTSLSTAQQAALKQQATSNLITRQGADAAGAFARESGTLAHQQQVLSSEFENLKSKLGAVLLPVLTRVLSFVTGTALPAFERWGASLKSKLAPAVENVKEGFNKLQEKLRPVGEWFSKHPELIQGAAIALGIAAVAATAFAIAMGAVALATSPITLVIVAIAAVGAAIAYAYKNSETFRNAVQSLGQKAQEVFNALKPIVLDVINALIAKWQELQPQVMAVFASIGTIITNAMSIINSVIGIAVSVITALWNRFGATILAYISGALSAVVTVVKGVFQIISGIFQAVSSALKGDWSGLWDGIKKIVSGALNVVKGVIAGAWNFIKTLTSLAWSALTGLVSAAWEGIKSAVSAGISGVVNFVKGIPGKIKSALGDLGGLLRDAGTKVIQGLLDGIGDMFGKVKDKLNSLTNLLPDWKGPAKKDKVILRKSGQLIIQGLIDGFADGTPSVEKFLGALTTNIKAQLDKRYDGKELKKRTKAVLKGFKAEYAALRANAAAQDAVQQKLTDARAVLADLVKQSADYANNIRTTVVATGDVARIGAGLGGRLSAGNIIQQLQKKVEDARTFTALIAQLTKSGLNQTAIQQMIDAGVEGGLATAQALVDGGADAVAQVNSLQAQLNAVGTQLGNSTAQTMYGAGIQAAQGLVAGLESQSAAIAAAAAQIAKTLSKAVKKALKIKSPSRVFREIGEYVTDGLVIGLDSAAVGTAGARLSAALEDGFSQPALTALVSGAGSSQPLPIQVTLTADALDQLSRGRQIQADLNAWQSVGGRALA